MKEIGNDQDKLKNEALSRKQFLRFTGKSFAIGGLVVAGINQNGVFGQTGKNVLSPPARVPARQQEPIVLEKWKSEVDQQSGPIPTPLPADQRIGYAIVGLGHLALEEVLPALSSCKKSRLIALVSGTPEKMKKVASQYGVTAENCYSYERFDDLKNNKAVDVIYIILPNALHKEYTIRGAKAGKHILCEKPMAISSRECEEMIAACKKSNVKLMVAYRIQYQPHNRKVKSLIQSKEFGVPKFIEASNGQSSANPEHWRHKIALAGGGALPDIGLYCLNTTRFILGEEPTEVFAYQYSTPGNPLFKEVEELISWQMKFPGGIIASCNSDYNVHEIKDYRVLCEKGWMDLKKAYSYHGQDLKTARAKGKLELQENIGMAETNQFAVEMDHFSNCILTNKRPYTPGEEGLQDHIIMEAIYKSAKEGKPVKINSAPAYTTLHGPEPELD